MTRHSPALRARGSKGFTLIELMVAVTIGLMVSVAIFTAYLGTSASSKLADAQVRMNEDGQAALTILGQQLRMAGINPAQAGRSDTSRFNPVYLPQPVPNPDPGPNFSADPATFARSDFILRGCDGTFTNLQSAANLDALQCNAGANPSPDSIAVSYEADRFNTIPTSANVPTDCVGVALPPITATFSAGTNPGPYTYYVADNRFYVGTSAAVVAPTLYCKGNGANSVAQPLVENIEDLQFNYGAVALATEAGNVRTAGVAGYLTANDTTNLTGVPNDSQPWQKVITVQVCVQVRSTAPVLTDSAAGSYFNCAGTLTAAPDLRLRHAYRTTVVLRNRRS